MAVATVTTFAELVGRARTLIRADRPAVLGIAGTPGSGKTTLAEAVVAALSADGLGDGRVVHAPMDGFHLADVALRRLGRLERKGAPDTFDPGGYAALLSRVRALQPGSGPVYAPAFDRDIEQPVAGSIPVTDRCRLLVTEGNYLLDEAPAWVAARSLADEVWFCDVDSAERRNRLVGRHIRFGKAPDAAAAWVADVDERNALLIEVGRTTADLVVAPLPELRPAG